MAGFKRRLTPAESLARDLMADYYRTPTLAETPLPSYDYYSTLVRPTPTDEQLFQAQLNPHGPAVSVQAIVSPVYGNVPRSADPALENFIRTTDSPLAAGAAQFAKPVVGVVGNILGTVVDALLPPSDPSPLVTFADGTRVYHMGEGTSTGDMANFVLLAAPPVLSGASRPAGQLVVRTANEAATGAPIGAAQPQSVSTGALFNRVRASKYPHNEVYVENPAGGYSILDSYKPNVDIVSRKFTQLSEVSEATARSYIREAATKYAPGNRKRGQNYLLSGCSQLSPLLCAAVKQSSAHLPSDGSGAFVSFAGGRGGQRPVAEFDRRAFGLQADHAGVRVPLLAFGSPLSPLSSSTWPRISV